MSTPADGWARRTGKLSGDVAPAVLANVLGLIAEPAKRQSLLLSQGDPTIFSDRPISGAIMIAAWILIALPIIKIMRDRARRSTATA